MSDTGPSDHTPPEPPRPEPPGSEPPALRATILGCGDAFGSGGRFHSAMLVEAGGHAGLVDCGATVMTALNRTTFDPGRIEFVLLTHLHGDHSGGLPFLLMDAQWVRGRTAPLLILGPPGTAQHLDAAFEALYLGARANTPWSFPWRVEEVMPGTPVGLPGFDLLTASVEHPSEGPATAVRLMAGGRTLVHSGDSEWVEALPALARGADLVFLDCTGYDRPVPGHLDYASLVPRRGLFDAPQVVLTHLGPDMLGNLDGIDRTLYDVAWDGRVFAL